MSSRSRASLWLMRTGANTETLDSLLLFQPFPFAPTHYAVHCPGLLLLLCDLGDGPCYLSRGSMSSRKAPSPMK